jgi:hypothetical protein
VQNNVQFYYLIIFLSPGCVLVGPLQVALILVAHGIQLNHTVVGILENRQFFRKLLYLFMVWYILEKLFIQTLLYLIK